MSNQIEIKDLDLIPSLKDADSVVVNDSSDDEAKRATGSQLKTYINAVEKTAVQQAEGTSTTNVMSQDAVTKALADKADKDDIPDSQVQSDFNQTDDTKPDYIKNKPNMSEYIKEADFLHVDDIALKDDLTDFITEDDIEDRFLEIQQDVSNAGKYAFVGTDGKIVLVEINFDINYFITSETLTPVIGSANVLGATTISPATPVIKVNDIITDADSTQARVTSISLPNITAVTISRQRNIPPISEYAQDTSYFANYFVKHDGKLYIVNSDFTSDDDEPTVSESLVIDIEAGNLNLISTEGNTSADKVSYDNTTSGITSDNVQDALDELIDIVQLQGGSFREYDLTNQLDGIEIVFDINPAIVPGMEVVIFYAGLRLNRDDYEIDYINNTLEIDVDPPLDSDEGRRLILVVFPSLPVTEYDLTYQVDGVAIHFILPSIFNEDNFIGLYYAGLRLVGNGINYEIDWNDNKITILDDIKPLDALEGRRLIAERSTR